MTEIIWNALGAVLFGGVVASVIFAIHDAKREAHEINVQQYLSPEEREQMQRK